MPWAAVAPALVTAVGDVVGGAMSSRASNNATKAEAAAAASALQFEREQEARRQKEYDEQQAALKAQWDAEQQRRAPYRAAAAAILARHGVKVPESASSNTMPAGWKPEVSTGQTKAPMTLASIAGMVPQAQTPEAAVPPLVPPRLTIANLGQWNKWGAQ